MNAPHPGRAARGRRPAAPVRRLARGGRLHASTSSTRTPATRVPTLDGYAGLVVMGGAMSANDDEVLGLDRSGQGADPRRRHRGRPDPRHLPRPPADRRRARRAGRRPTRAASRSGCSRSAGPRRRPATGSSAAWPRRGAACSGTTTSSSSRPPSAVVLAQTPDGEVQVARFGPSAWGVQLHPEVDETIVGTWVTDSERGELADRGLDADALLAEIKEAREELDHAWAPLAAGFADVALGPRRRARPLTMPEHQTLHDEGPPDPARLPGSRAVAGQPRSPSRARPSRCSRCSPAPRTPTSRWPRWSGWSRPRASSWAGRAELLLQALVDDEGTAMRLLSVLGASEALADHLCRHPEHWRELTDPDAGLDPTRGVRRPGGAAARGRGRPGRRPADRDRAGRRGGGRAARRVPPAPAPPGLPRPDPPPRGRRRRRRAVRPRGRHPRRGAGHRPAAGRGARRPSWPGWRSSPWASAAATSSTTSPTST